MIAAGVLRVCFTTQSVADAWFFGAGAAANAYETMHALQRQFPNRTYVVVTSTEAANEFQLAALATIQKLGTAKE